VLGRYSDVAIKSCRYLIGPCVFNNVGRWPKREVACVLYHTRV